MKTVAVLMTCHNRKEKTLSCLESLFSSRIPDGVTIFTYLVDDGSVDGTGNAVRQTFPNVNVLSGDGSLYWAGGMRKAWGTAADVGYDYYLWLNDDTVLYDDAISSMLALCEANDSRVIVCGNTVDPRDKTRWTYGGYDSDWKPIAPGFKEIECDFFNGNCVLIPAAVYSVLGNIERAYTHSLGDFDYGIRAKKVGIKMLISAGYQGECESHDRLPRWCRNEGAAKDRLRFLYEPLGCNPFEFFVYDKRQNGILSAVWHFGTLHLRAVAPWLWKSAR